MRIDLRKVAAAAAVDAALHDAKPSKRLTAPRAIVAGATLAVAARYAVTKVPSLARVPALSDVPAAAEKGGEQGGRLVDRLVTQRTLGATVCVAQYDACGLGANDLVTLDQLVRSTRSMSMSDGR